MAGCSCLFVQCLLLRVLFITANCDSLLHRWVSTQRNPCSAPFSKFSHTRNSNSLKTLKILFFFKITFLLLSFLLSKLQGFPNHCLCLELKLEHCLCRKAGLLLFCGAADAPSFHKSHTKADGICMPLQMHSWRGTLLPVPQLHHHYHHPPFELAGGFPLLVKAQL